MEALQRASQFLLTKYTLLVLCVHLCAALNYYSFYTGLIVNDFARILPLPTMCECHNACKAMLSCTAATHVAEPGSEPKCLISETLEITKADLNVGDAKSHATLIKGYQVKYEGTQMTFQGAKQACNDMRMRLATPSDAASFDLLAKIHEERFGNTRDDWLYWMDVTKVDNVWRWGDGVEVTAGVGEPPWGPGYPTSGDHGVAEAYANLLLQDRTSDYPYGFICTP